LTIVRAHTARIDRIMSTIEQAAKEKDWNKQARCSRWEWFFVGPASAGHSGKAESD
jgi:hypothetical protein